jgi:hypothetical protein
MSSAKKIHMPSDASAPQVWYAHVDELLKCSFFIRYQYSTPIPLDVLLSQSPLQRPTERSELYSFSRILHTNEHTMSIADRMLHSSS